MPKQMLTSTHPFFSNFPNWVIGHDRLFQEMLRVVDDVAYPSSSGANYPPHDIIKQDEENFCIEMALAGFKKDELTIPIKKTIKNKIPKLQELLIKQVPLLL